MLDAGSRLNPQSINRVLGISGSSVLNSFSVEGGSGSYGGIWTSGHLHLYGENVVLYIQSPELTSFNSSQGPQGESTIMRRINTNNVPYGSFVCDKGFFELDYFVAACRSLKTFTIRLVNARGSEVNLNGHDWSFSLIFQELP